MARLVGFIANRPDLGSRALSLDHEAFTVRAPEAAPASAEAGSVSWGIGFYQGAEILLQRRPYDDRRTLSLPDLIKDVRAEVLIGHVRTATVGALRSENTHPFRYRQWLYAHTGTVPHFERLRGRLLESLPQFLARDVRGDTDAELVFYLFLSFLHDTGKLDRGDVAAADVRQAVRSALSLLDGLVAEEGSEPLLLNMLIACGEYVIGVRTARAMGFSVLSGRQALERLFGGESFSRTKIPHLMSARISVIAGDFDEDRLPRGYQALEPRSTVTLSHSDAPHLESL